MRGRLCGFALCSVAASLALPVSSQVPRSRKSTVELGNQEHAVRLPYTAEYKTVQVKILADGSTITHEWTEVVAVDSQGRHMTSTTTNPPTADQPPTTHIVVFDPVARIHSNWNVPGERATVVSMPAPGTTGTSCATPAAESAPITLGERVRISHERPVVEDLGVDTIQGVEARGRRSTTATPAGAVGNDEPLKRTTETWSAIAPGLAGVVVRNVVDDPQSGKNTRELVSFRQEEPDPSIFEPPAGYEVVNREAESCFAPVGPRTEPAVPMPPPE